MRGLRKALAMGAASAIGALAIHGCLDPTQATLNITTNATCTDLKGVAITAADSPASAEARATSFPATVTTMCSQGSIGTLVLTPGEVGSTAAVIVVAGVLVPVEQCLGPLYAGCIVARRRFNFVDHVPLKLPIEMSIECRDVPCDSLSTCNKGKCVSSEVTCTESGGCAGLGEEVVNVSPTGKDGASNDGNVFLDGGADGSATKDGSVDTGPPPILIEGNAWSSSGCCRNDGDGGCAGFCIGYTIGQCGNSDPYGGACENYDASGPSQCGHDPRTTFYRCMHEYCARGCGPGGSPPDYNWIPYFSCTDSGACGPPL